MENKVFKIFFTLFLICSGVLYSCSTRLDLYAPAKELYVVYCILDPNEEVQYAKISQVLQYEGDVVSYAANQDPSATGLKVTLEGGGKTYQAVVEDSLYRDDEGNWANAQSLYRFETGGSDTIIPGEKYKLTVTKEEDPEFTITADTKIPQKVFLKTFNGPFIIDSIKYSFPTAELNDEISVYFLKNEGYGFEIRASMDYFENGQQRSAHFGPTPAFSQPNGCLADNPNQPELCYVIPPQAILRNFNNALDLAAGAVTYTDSPRIALDPALLNRSCRLEVTSLDSNLSVFLNSNEFFGFGLNLLLDKKEYTNISGDNIGIFGAINYTQNYFYLSTCSQYLLGLVDTETPPANCNW